MTARPARALATALAAVVLTACTAEPDLDAGGDLAPMAWEVRAPMPTPRTEVAAAAADGRIVVAGGFDAEGRTVATVEIYDVEADEWSSGPDLPVPVNHAMAASNGSFVFVFGGYDENGAPVSSAWALEGDAWGDLGPMPEPRAAGGAAIAHNLAWVVGGIGPGGELATRTLLYDFEGAAWTTAPGLGTRREHLGVATLGDHVYALAGRVGGLEGNLRAAERYDVGSGAWEVVADVPTARGGTAAAAGEGLVIVAGGEENAGTFAEVEAFAPGARAWTALPELLTPRHGLGLVVVDSVLYAVGGGPEPGLTVTGALEALDLRTV